MSDFSKDSISSAIGAWQFMADNTFHLDPFSDLPWIHDPYLLVNSLGGGFCDDRSSALVALWKDLGYDGRIIELNGHVLPEVLEEGKWKLFDPDHEVYYTDPEGKIIGLKQLEDYACEQLTTNGSNQVQGILWGCELFDSEMQMGLYTSSDDNLDATDWNMNFESVLNQLFTLPPEAELVFSNGEEASHSFAVVRLSSFSTGLLHIPLVPYALTGNGELRSKKSVYSSKNGDITVFDNSIFNDSLFIQQVDGELLVYYHINPAVCQIQQRNSVLIYGEEEGIEVKSIEKVQSVYSEQRFDAMRIEGMRANHFKYLNQMPRNLSFSTMDGLRKEYVRFLDLDIGISAEARDSLTLHFYNDLQLVLDTLDCDEVELLRLTGERYPHSIFWLFLPMRYGAYRYLHRLRFQATVDHLSVLP